MAYHVTKQRETMGITTLTFGPGFPGGPGGPGRPTLP